MTSRGAIIAQAVTASLEAWESLAGASVRMLRFPTADIEAATKQLQVEVVPTSPGDSERDTRSSIVRDPSITVFLLHKVEYENGAPSETDLETLELLTENLQKFLYQPLASITERAITVETPLGYFDIGSLAQGVFFTLLIATYRSEVDL